MNWTDIERAWGELVDRIVAQWPEANRERLFAIAGNRDAFTAYIAERHDLTHAEATDAVDYWVARLSAR